MVLIPGPCLATGQVAAAGDDAGGGGPSQAGLPEAVQDDAGHGADSARCYVYGFFYTCTCGTDSCVPVGLHDDCALVDALQSMRQIARALRIFAYQENLPIMVHCIHGEALAMK